MAEVKITVKNVVEGEKQIGGLGQQWNSLKSTLGSVTGALGVVTAGMVATWKVAEQGAALELTRDRFDKLAKSIGTTAGALTGDLSAATGGMMSDAQMMASASQIISLGLADNQKDVVDLASLVSELGWDMQQVILTFANNSKMRLDALGLSVTDVEERAAALEEQGYNTDKAFDLAVIQAGQAKLELLGSAAGTSAGNMKELTASLLNMVDAAKMSVSEGIQPTVQALNTLFAVYRDGGGEIDAIIGKQLDEADSVAALVEIYQKLNDAKGLGATVTGSNDAINRNLEATRDQLILTAGSAEEYADAIVAMGIPGIDASQITEGVAETLRQSAIAEYEASKNALILGRSLEEVAQEAATADAVMLSYMTTTTETEGVVRWFGNSLDQARTRMQNMMEAQSDLADELEESKLAYDELRTAQNEAFQQRFITNINDTTGALGRYVTTATAVGGMTETQQANFDELSSASERLHDNIRSLQGGTAGLGLTEDELNKKLTANYEQLALIEGAMGPLTGITTEYTNVQRQWVVDAEAVNSAMLSSIDAATDSTEKYGLAAIALGAYSKEEYLAAMNATIMQAEMDKLAKQYADGTITLGEMTTGLENLVNNSPYVTSFDMDDNDALNKLHRIREMLDGLDGRRVTSYADVVTGEGGKGGSDKDDDGGGTSPVPMPPGAASQGMGGYGPSMAGAGAGGRAINISFAGAVFMGTTAEQASQITSMVAEGIGRL